MKTIGETENDERKTWNSKLLIPAECNQSWKRSKIID